MLQEIPALKMPCPRCGKQQMNADMVENALSRHEDIYICSECGREESAFDFVGQKKPLEQMCIRDRDCIGKTLNRLKEQLAEPSGPGKDFWWCPVTDLELLKVKIVDEPIKVAIVTDRKSAIICELPDSIEEGLFVEID